MAATYAANVERSLVSGLSRVPILRSPAFRGTGLAPPLFEVPELAETHLNSAASAGQAVAEAEPFDGDNASAMEGSAAEAVGANVMFGATYGFLGRLVQPRLNQLARRAGPRAGAVRFFGNLGTLSVAYGMTTLCREGAKKLGGVLVKIPILGHSGVVGSTLQFALSSIVGDKLAKMLEPEAEAGPVYLSNICLMCNSNFAVGSGQQVAALSCGHACLCNSVSDGAAFSCIAQYLQRRSDCPLCRVGPVEVLHELRI